MTTKEFQLQVKNICNAYSANMKDDRERYYIQTIFGTLFFKTEWIPRKKVCCLYIQLDGDIKGFKEKMYERMSTTGKCNFYSSTPDFVLNDLSEILDNLRWLEYYKQN